MSERDDEILYEEALGAEDSVVDDISDEERGLREYNPEAEEYYDDGMLVVRTSGEEARYDELFDKGSPRSRFLSVASMILGIISVALSFTGWWALIVGVAAILLSMASRRNLKYFDRMSIAGLILGIFGLVFGGAFLFVLYGPFADIIKSAFN